MPRMLRLQSPGSFVHIMARGIDGKAVFTDDRERESFLARFSALRRITGHTCYAWSLMDNHYHLLLATNENPLSDLMRPLNGGYARWFNKRHKRRGYLFQDRYKSVLCQDPRYALQLVRYIHLNALRAGKVPSLKTLCDWQWSGHALLLGRRGALGQGFQEWEVVLRWFATTRDRARQAYLTYLAKGVDAGGLSQAGGMPDTESAEHRGAYRGWPAVIGDPDFVRQVMSSHAIGSRRRHRKADYDAVLRKLAAEACREFGVTEGALLVRGRHNARSAARARFCRMAHHEEFVPMSVVARYLNVTIPAVAKLVRRGGGESAPAGA